MGLHMLLGRWLTVPGLFAVLIVAPASEAAASDSILLRTGELFSGRILRVTDREVSIQLDSGGILSFRRPRIRRVRRWLPGEASPETIEMDREEDSGASPSPTASGPDSLHPTPGSLPIVNPPSNPPTAPPPTPEPLPVQPLPRTPDVPVQVTVIRPKDSGDAVGPVWTIRAPDGFERVGIENSEEVLESWVEPASQASVVLAHYEVDASAEDFKKQVLATCPGSKRPRFHRDLPLNREGEGGFHGWIVELEQVVGDVSVHQLQLYVKSPTGVFVLRCTAPSASYPALSSTFEESLHSFRLGRH